MTLTSDRARLDGRVVATDLDRALELLNEAERARSEAAVLLGRLQGTDLERFLGYVSWERLVAHRAGCGGRAAFDLVRVARHLDRFADTATAVTEGRVGLAAAEVLAKAAAGLGGAYRTAEAELLEVASEYEVEDLERVCRLWRARADHDAAATNAQHRWEQRGIWLQQAFDGSCTGRLALDAIGAEVVAAALETRPDSTNSMAEPRTAAQRRADRLVDLCTIARGGEHGPSGSTKAAVDVVIDIHTLAGDIPPALRRAIRLRDRHCTFAGCDRPWRWCDLHHLVPRHQGGPTTSENLTLLCRFHHGLVHDGGWQLARAPDGSIQTCSP